LIIWRTRWNEHALREQFGERVRAVDLPHVGHFLPFCCRNSRKL